MTDPYGAPRDDPNGPSPWSNPQGGPVPYQPAQPPPQQSPWAPGQAPEPWPGMPSQPGAPYQPGPAYPPGAAYPPGPPYQPGAPYQPGMPYPPGAVYPAPPRRSRTLAIVLISVAAVLVLGVVVVAAVVTRSSSGKGSAARAAATSPSGPAAASADPTGGGSFTLTAPDQIGALKKAKDQSDVDDMRKSMDVAGVEQSFAVEYEDTAAANKPVLVWGATGRLFGLLDPKRQLDAFFTGVGKTVSGGNVGDRTTADPGTVGGRAECANVAGTGVVVTLCAWTGGDALLGVIFLGESVAQGGGQLHTILPAVATRR